jgi:hypothetical protein
MRQDAALALARFRMEAKTPRPARFGIKKGPPIERFVRVEGMTMGLVRFATMMTMVTKDAR